MNFLVDAQLPRRLAYRLRDAGHDVIHTLEFHRLYKLLLISTGNIANVGLEHLFVSQIPAITTAFETYEYLELTRDNLIFHS